MSRDAGWEGVRLLTIGHSTRSLEELIALLEENGVEILADIRTVPKSRRNPWFAIDALSRDLPRHGIRYVHLAALGGLRRPRRDSPNAGWRNESFRGYADYMQTSEFEAGLGELRALCEEGQVAIMCAEAVPWRCHRSLVADVVSVRGGQVAHVMGPGKANAHKLTPFGMVEGDRVLYPPAEG